MFVVSLFFKGGRKSGAGILKDKAAIVASMVFDGGRIGLLCFFALKRISFSEQISNSSSGFTQQTSEGWGSSQFLEQHTCWFHAFLFDFEFDFAFDFAFMDAFFLSCRLFSFLLSLCSSFNRTLDAQNAANRSGVMKMAK